MIQSRPLIIPIVIGAAVLVACGASKTPTEPTLTIPANLPPSVTVAMVQDGDTLYARGSCTTCHGPAGTAGPHGPALNDSVFLHSHGFYEEIVDTITTGVPLSEVKASDTAMQPKGGMSWTDAQVRSVAAYVWVLSHPQGCGGTPC